MRQANPIASATLLAVAIAVVGCSAQPPSASSGLTDGMADGAAPFARNSDALSSATCPWGEGECLWPLDNDLEFGTIEVTDQVVGGVANLPTHKEVLTRFPMRGEGFPSAVLLQVRVDPASKGALRVELQTDLGAVVATGALPHDQLCASAGNTNDCRDDVNKPTANPPQSNGQAWLKLNMTSASQIFVVGAYYQLRVFAKAAPDGSFKAQLGQAAKGDVASVLAEGWTRVTTAQPKKRLVTDYPLNDTLAFMFAVSASRPPSCANGVRDASDIDGDETDIDCGGTCVDVLGSQGRCDAGRRCVDADRDCAAGLLCRSLAQDTGLKSGTKCGAGEVCGCGAKRKPGGRCGGNGECLSNICTIAAGRTVGVCTAARPAHCSNGQADAKKETDTDCGGTICSARCGAGLACKAASDCDTSTGLTCIKGRCASAFALQASCSQNGDCASGLCSMGKAPVCLATNLDDASACLLKNQCRSGVCPSPAGATSRTCAAPGTTDKLRNGTETDVDCGGASGVGCGPGMACSVNTDCDGATRLVCDGGKCRAPGGVNAKASDFCLSRATSGKGKARQCTDSASCSDGFLNGNETDVDRGGAPFGASPACPRVAAGGLCRSDGDCADGRCSGSGKCLKPTCRDGVRNNGEAGIDCGSRACGICPPGTTGILPEEASTVCSSKLVTCTKAGGCSGENDRSFYRCTTPRCDDGVINGTESSIDGTEPASRECGGSCGPCPVALTGAVACRTSTDCASGLCRGAKKTTLGACVPATATDGIRNQDETGIDCGGATTKGCSLGQGCRAPEDCVTGTLCVDGNGTLATSTRPVSDGRCSPTSCTDGIFNSRTESDRDCGKQCGTLCNPANPALCSVQGDGLSCACKYGTDCLSGVCAAGTCIAAGRSDGKQNGNETGVDCGCVTAVGDQACVAGTFAKCALGSDCVRASDCASAICTSGICASGPCGNGANVACGRGCALRCDSVPDGKTPSAVNSCFGAVDCASYNCQEGHCYPASICPDGSQKVGPTCAKLSPSKAGNVNVTTGHVTASIRWSSADTNGGSAVTGYVVAWAAGTSAPANCDGPNSRPVSIGTSLEITAEDGALSPGTDYVFAVCATNQRGVTGEPVTTVESTKACTPVLNCAEGLTCSSGSNQICAECTAGFYYAPPDDTFTYGRCLSCPKGLACPKGTNAVDVATGSTQLSCPHGSWSAGGAATCAAWTPACDPGSGYVDGTAESDRTCVTCNDPEAGTLGTWSGTTGRGACLPWTRCGTDSIPTNAAETMTSRPDAASDRTCAPCDSGYIANVLPSTGNAAECVDVTPPTDPVVTALPARSSIRLDWDIPADEGSPIDHYRVAFHRSGAGRSAAPVDCEARLVDPYGQEDVVEVVTVPSSTARTALFGHLSPLADHGWRLCTVDAAGNRSTGAAGSTRTQLCTSIAHCASGLACNTDEDQTCGACDDGYERADNYRRCALADIDPDLLTIEAGYTAAVIDWTANHHELAGAAYVVARKAGSTPPASCDAATGVVLTNAGTAERVVLSSLADGAGYAVRICVVDGSTLSAGLTGTFFTRKCDAVDHCASGLTCTSAADQTCGSCEAGYFRNGNGQCVTCPASHYCPEGASQPLACGTGKVSTTGAAACVACGAGEYWTGVACALCDAGYQSAGGAATTCSDVNECLTNNGGCGGGDAAQASCHNTDGGYSCACTGEYFGNGTSCSAATPCAPGSYVVRGLSSTVDRQCADCPTGQFSSSANQTNCIAWRNCDAGTGWEGGTDRSNSSCTPCEAGSYSYGGTRACTPWRTCHAGSYVKGVGSDATDRECDACIAGYTTTTANATTCVDNAPPPNPFVTATPGKASIRLDWPAAVDPYGSGLRQLIVLYNRSGTAPDTRCPKTNEGAYAADEAQLLSAAAQSFTFAATNGVPYAYRVCAEDNAGNVSEGAVSGQSVQTQACDGITHCASDKLNCDAAGSSCSGCTLGFALASDGASCDDTTVPADPSGVTATASFASLSLNWPAVTDSDGTGLNGYKVAWAAGTTPPNNCAHGTYAATAAAVITGLDNESVYAFRVCALDNATPANVSVGVTGTATTLVCNGLDHCAGELTCTTGTNQKCGRCMAGYVPNANGVCVACASGTWSDEGASICSSCPQGTWSAAGASVCRNWSACAPGSSYTAGSASADSTCTPCLAGTASSGGNAACTSCGSGAFSGPGAASCTPWRSCAPGFGYAAGSSTTNATCTACISGKWSPGGTTACTAWSTCPSGKGYAAGTTSSDAVCMDCDAGSFSLGGTAACVAWRNCDAGLGWTTGSATNDASCTACVGNSYSDGGTMACTVWRDCAPGYGKAAGSSSSDSVCAACDVGTYSDGTKACAPWRTCDAGHGRISGTASTNATCTPCAGGTYSFGGTSGCGLCTAACAIGHKETVACTTTTDRVCSVIDCAAGEFWNGLACASCANGYSSSGGYATNCGDVDECQTNNGGCGGGDASKAACSNTPGSYGCSCNSGSFDPTGGTNPATSGRTCSDWTTCAAGTSVSFPGNATTDRTCAPCVNGTFSTTTNAVACANGGTCSAGFGYAAGTATSDRTCTACTGETFSTGGTRACTAWSHCTAGFFVGGQPSASADRLCTLCAAGYSSSDMNVAACSDVTAPNNPDVVAVPARTSASLNLSGGFDAGSGLHHFLVSWAQGTTLPAAHCANGVEISGAATITKFTALDQETTYAYRVCAVDVSGNVSTGAAGTTTTQLCTAIAHCSKSNLTCDTETDQTCSGCEPGFTVSGDLKACHDLTAPSNPTGLSSNPSPVAIALTWSPVDDSSGLGLAGYRVAFRAGAVAPTACTSTDALATTNSLTLTGLANASAYGWRICSIDKAGNLSSGVTGTASTLGCGSVAHCAGTVTCTTATDQVCSVCQAGYYSVAGQCVACAAGTYSASGATSCATCADGSFSGSAAVACTPWRTCASGEGYAPGSAASNATCTLCGAGTASSGGTSACTACAAGTFAASTGLSTCTSAQTCAPGSYVSTVASAYNDRVCSPCASGSYSSTANASSCTAWSNCGAGDGYAAGTSTTNSHCTPCASGHYSTGGTMACTPWQTCAPGRGYWAGTSSANATCILCGAGTSSAGVTDACSVCPAGTYAGSSGASQCTAWQTCAAGYGYTAGSASGNASCNACVSGTNWTSGGTMACTTVTTCAAGTYVSTTPTTFSDRVCSSCQSGYTTTTTNASSCVDLTAPFDVRDAAALPAETTLTLSWTDVDDVNGGSGIKGYNLAYQAGTTPPAAGCGAANGVTVVFVPTSSTTDYITTTLTGLATTTGYAFRVCAVDNANNVAAGTTVGAFGTRATTLCSGIANCPDANVTCTDATDQTCSACNTGFTLSAGGTACSDTTPPSEPSSVAASTAYASVTLSWPAVTDGAGSGLKGYRVAYQAGASAPSDCAGVYTSTATTSVTIPGLSNDSGYAFRVCAEDFAKNSSVGVTAMATTLACNAVPHCQSGVTCTTSTDQTCGTCAAGYAKNGSGECAACLPGSFAPAGAVSCASCSTGSYSGTAASSCTSCASSCGSGTYESQPCTLMNNRVCTAISCAAGQFWTGAACAACPTGFTSVGGAATSCDTDVNECLTNNGGCGGGSSTAARCTNTFGGYRCSCNAGYTGDGASCSAINCAAGQYWNGLACASCASGYTSPGGVATSCTDVNECVTNNGGCGGGDATKGACTNTTGGFTCGCNSGYYGTGVTCSAWTTCAAGHYVAAAPTSTADRICVACGSGTYSTVTNAATCATWPSCSAGAGFTAGSSTSNSVCTACTGSTWSQGGTMACAAWQTCAAGTYVTHTPSSLTDRACAACAAGYSSSTQNAVSCADVTAPASPEISGVVPSSDNIGVSWYPVIDSSGSGLASYLVAYRAGYTAPTAGCSGGASTSLTSATITGLSLSTYYSVRVCAVDHAGNVSSGTTAGAITQVCAGVPHCGGSTSCATGTPVCNVCEAGWTMTGGGTSCTDTTAPANLTAVTATPAYVSAALTWPDVSDALGSGLRGYRVAWASGSTAPGSCAATDDLATLPTYTRTGLANGTTYAFRVCAEDYAGNRSAGFTGTVATSACNAVANCAGAVTCTTSTDAVCALCAAGTYRNASGICSSCAAGTYADIGSTRCTACADGSYAAAGAGSCTLWTTGAAGSYVSGAGTTTTDLVCLACPTHTFASGTNAASCTTWTTCSAGTFVVNSPTATSDRLCTPCSSGSYAGSTNEGNCMPWSPCAAGTYVSNTPSASVNRLCAPCTSGTNYSASTNASSCAPVTTTGCAAGSGFTAATLTNDGVCTACSDANYATGGTMACMPWTVTNCGAGYGFTSGTASRNGSCTACTAWTYSTGGTNSCSAWQTCPAGFGYSTGTSINNSTCTACSNGNYSTGGTMVCTPWSVTGCSAGLGYTDGTGSTTSSCNACSTGFYSPGGKAACLAKTTCAPGFGYTATDATVDSSCTACSAGKYSTGQTMACTSCQAGYATSITGGVAAAGATQCYACPQYTYATNPGTASCSACSTGTYNTGTGNTACSLTDTTKPGRPASIASVTTSGGLTVTWPAVTDAASGTKGYYIANSTAGGAAPSACKTTSRLFVPAGTLSIKLTGLQGGATYKAGVCTVDNAGNISSIRAGGGAVAGCAAGLGLSGSTCSACSAGSWSDGSVSCAAWSSCAAGSFVTNVPSASVNRICSNCAAGTFTSSANQTSCSAWTVSGCAAGNSFTAGTSTADARCTACIDGSTYSTGGTMACTTVATCGAGTYVTQTPTTYRNRTCGACSSETYATTTNASTCSACTAPCATGYTATTQCTTTTNRICSDVTSPTNPSSFAWSSEIKSGSKYNVTLNWAASASDAGSGVAGYRIALVQAATAPAACTATDATFAGASTATGTLTGLSPNKAYSYRLCAYDVVGNHSSGVVVEDVKTGP